MFTGCAQFMGRRCWGVCGLLFSEGGCTCIYPADEHRAYQLLRLLRLRAPCQAGPGPRMNRLSSWALHVPCDPGPGPPARTELSNPGKDRPGQARPARLRRGPRAHGGFLFLPPWPPPDPTNNNRLKRQGDGFLSSAPIPILVFLINQVHAP
jgi:hypothetical protein